MGFTGGWSEAIGNAYSGGQQANIGADQMAAINAINLVQKPTIAQMKVRLQQMVQQGILTPAKAQTFLQQATAYNEMDPTARNALLETINTKGLDPQAVAALHQLQQTTGEQAAGQRGAIMQNAAERGIAGSGIELASEMGANQNSATNLANQGFQAAADANARRMQAVSGLSNMDEQKAAAQDAINQFNTANRQSIENMNVNAANQAAAQNLAEKQRIADTNVGTKNQQELYNKGLYQSDFANQMARQQAIANTNLGAASSNVAEINAKQAPLNNQGKLSDENLKTDISEIDPKEMLDNLQGYKYTYKEGLNMDDGPQVGVMAQDLEKSAPQAVTDTPQGKMIDFGKMGGPILAALSSINDRLNEMEENQETPEEEQQEQEEEQNA